MPVRDVGRAKRDLWLRLKGYHFDQLVPAHLSDHVMAVFGGADAATRAFATKLSRKHGWSSRFALRAIEEYRKFIYLGMVSDVPVTPSRVIDQVWHEHLLFTRAYRAFCQEVLEREFDHNPELVSDDDQTETFRAQYYATLDLYEREFNTSPPDDIWAIPKFGRRESAHNRARRADGNTGTSSSDDSTPLFHYFDGNAGSDGHSHSSMPEFGGGGGFSGGGGGSSWGDTSHDSHEAGGHDGGGSDGGSSDSGSSSDGGGSSCSSGCGGGGE
ncbi:MAG: hypothetical protein H0W68_03670 [Gemmatimonadaceae bacterium]|nr:hypothetical protein [Gemmatimonadaceae bacterium]